MFKFIQKMRPDAGTKKILIQFIAEFWLPFLIAAVWTGFGWYSDKNNYPILIGGITNFFAAGWLFSQWNRIKKQKKSEDGLQSVQENINSLIAKLDASTITLLGNATGGDSFCELIPTPLTLRFPSDFVLIHHGKYPLYDFQVRIVDLDRSENIDRSISETENIFEFKVLPPQYALKIKLNTPDDEMRSKHRRLNICVTARNGGFKQLLQLTIVNGIQRRATRFIKDGEVFNERIDSDFPRAGTEHVDWSLHDEDTKFRFKRDLT